MADTPEEEAAEIDGLIGVIGSTGRVLLCDPTRHFPRRDPDGTAIGGADVVVSALGGNGRSLRLSGLPAGYALTAGDMVVLRLDCSWQVTTPLLSSFFPNGAYRFQVATTMRNEFF